MAFSGSQVTRIGLYGGTRSPYGLFSGKALAAPVFSGTIPDASYDFDSGNQITDYSSYFTGATSYSISPSVESGWSFDTLTGILTVDTDDANTFGPFTITGTNLSGSDSSNAFNITVNAAVAEIVGGGGWVYAYEDEIRKRLSGDFIAHVKISNGWCMKCAVGLHPVAYHECACTGLRPEVNPGAGNICGGSL